MMTNAVKFLLIANIVAYLIDAFLIPISSVCALYYVFTPNFHIYQLVTYMFMHGGLMHLFFNMFALWMFGRIIENTWGTQQFLIYYFVCGLGAAVVQEVCQFIGILSPYDMTVGASGAVYGILLAFGMLYPNERMIVFVPIPIPIKAKYLVIGYAAIELFEGMSATDHVAHLAHLGGMLFGFIFILLWKYSKRPDGGFNSSHSWRVVKTTPNTDFRYSNNDRNKDYVFNREKTERDREIDRILDKVRQDGYASLTEKEKRTLFDASK